MLSCIRKYRTIFAVWILVGIMTLYLFHVENSNWVILMGVLGAIICTNFQSCLSKVDIVVVFVYILDWINWIQYGNLKIDNLFVPTICIFMYIILKNVLRHPVLMSTFLKSICFPTIIVFGIVFITFLIFVRSLHEVGFINTYPFRFLFYPLGVLTNVWTEVYILLLALFSVGYYKVSHWKWIFACLWCFCSIALFFSFSRGAYVAWTFYILFVAIVVINKWREKLKFFFICVSIHSFAFVLFPREVSMTWNGYKTESQYLSAKSRYNASLEAFDVLKYECKLLGGGNNNYMLIMDRKLGQDSRFSYTSFAPNIVVSVLIEKGIIPFLLYWYLLYLIIKICYKKSDVSIQLVSAVIFSALLKEMTLCVAFDTDINYFLFYVLLAFVSSKEKRLITFKWDLKYLLLVLWGICLFTFIFLHVYYRKHEQVNSNAICYFEQKEYRKAALCLEKLPHTLPFLINKAALCAVAPLDSLPIDYMRSVQRELCEVVNPKMYDVFLLYLQAKLELRGQDKEKGYQLLQDIADKYSNNALYRYELYKLYQKDKEKSLTNLAKAIEISPRIISLLSAQEFNVVDSLFVNDALFKIDKSSKALAKYGYLAYHFNKRDKAKKYLIRALKQNPGLSVPYLLLSKIYGEEGNESKSKEYMEKYSLLNSGIFAKYISSFDNNIKFSSEILFYKDYMMKFQKWYGYSFLIQPSFVQKNLD